MGLENNEKFDGRLYDTTQKTRIDDFSSIARSCESAGKALPHPRIGLFFGASRIVKEQDRRQSDDTSSSQLYGVAYASAFVDGTIEVYGPDRQVVNGC